MTKIQKAETPAPFATARPAALLPMELLERALASNANPETLAQLMALQERWEANQAKKAFDVAIADAKAELPAIIKTREVDFTTPKGRTRYKYEDFATIARAVDPVLGRFGLNVRFRTSSPPNELVTVTCILSHRGGHSEETSLSAARDDSGNKNSIQAIGSTVVYLQRYTIKAALGLAAGDDDEAAAVKHEPISADEAENLRDMMTARGVPAPAFLEWARVEKIEDIAADHYDSCVEAIKQYKPTTAKPVAHESDQPI